MFEDIVDFKSPLAIENMLTPYKKGCLSVDKKSRLPKEPITPDVCMEILRSTNYARNIKDMLLCIGELPETEQAQFKDVVLASFTQREQSESVLEIGRKLAENGGYGALLSEICSLKEGRFLCSEPKLSYGELTSNNQFDMEIVQSINKLIYTGQGMAPLMSYSKLPEEILLPNCSRVYFSGSNLQGVKRISCAQGAEIYFDRVAYWPQNLDLSSCAKIWLDLQDLTPIKDWRYPENTLVFFTNKKSLYGNVNLSAYQEVNLCEKNLKAVTEIKFRKSAKVNLREAQLPTQKGLKMDFSQCAEVTLIGCDLAGLEELKFASGAWADLCSAVNFPKKTDFSQCGTLYLTNCSLRDFDNIVLPKNGRVNLAGCHDLPKVMDFSSCSQVNLKACQWKGVQKVIFRDRRQMENSEVSFPDDLGAEIVVGNETELMAKAKQSSGNSLGRFLGKIFAKGGR